MPRADRVDTSVLLADGLRLMRENGKPLERVAGRARIYRMSDGDTVLVRTNNDRRLLATADRPELDAFLDIQRSDWLLLVVPEVKRTVGNVAAYLVPAEEAADAVRSSHEAWLSSHPDTKGENKTWVLWLDPFPSNSAGSGVYAEKWAKYRLNGSTLAE